MAELKTLQEFYNPTMAVAALNAGINQQHLALQQQQVENQSKNMQIDNLKQALSVANPMESYPIYKQLMELNGQQAPSVNDYYANLPSLQAKRGAQQLNVAAGLGGNEDVAELTRQSPALQGKIGEALAIDPLKKIKLEALQQQQEAHAKTATFVNAQLNTLVPATKAAGLAIERVTPHVEQLANLQAEYDKNVKSMGITKAAGLRQDKLAANPELAQFQQRRLASIPQLQQSVQQLEDVQTQLQSRAELIARGVAPLQEGESLELLAGQVDASTHQLDYVKAQLAFAKDPTKANLQAVQAVKARMDETVTRLTEQKNASQSLLDVHRGALDEKKLEYQDKKRLLDATNQGQQLFAALPTAQQTPQAAAKIAAQVKAKTGVDVGTKDILEGIKLPNTPLVSITQGQEKAEASVVGTEFGKQYTTLQNAAVSASDKLSKLDRMEQLLQGVQTGKLTPAITQVQAIGEALGIQVDKTLPAKQALESLTNEIALGLRNPSGGAGMPGALSDKDREFLLAMPAGLGKTPEGNRLIIETSRALEQRSQQVAKMARAYRKKHGQFDEGFLEELQSYSEQHPLFAGKQAPTETAPASGPVAPFDDAEKERRYQEWKSKHK